MLTYIHSQVLQLKTYLVNFAAYQKIPSTVILVIVTETSSQHSATVTGQHLEQQLVAIHTIRPHEVSFTKGENNTENGVAYSEI